MDFFSGAKRRKIKGNEMAKPAQKTNIVSPTNEEEFAMAL